MPKPEWNDPTTWLVSAPEPARRAIGLLIFALMAAGTAFIAASEIGKRPQTERGDDWRLFLIATGLLTLVSGWYAWRKLTRPDFDTKFTFKTSALFFLLLTVSSVIVRVAARDADTSMIVIGTVCGLPTGLVLVYGFDWLAGKLSKGRSWNHGDPRFEPEPQSSNTKSPT